MIFNDEREFKTAEKFVEFFHKDPFFRTSHIYEANTLGRGTHIFRGQSDSTWKLIPSVFRSDEALNSFTPQPPGVFSEQKSNEWLGLQLHAELRSLTIFLETADRLGIETPIDYSRLRDHHELISSLLNDKKFDYSLPFPNALTLEEMALGQHHGVPTRLLDWTESPFVACFFAARPASSVADPANKVSSDHLAVVCLDTYSFSNTGEIECVRAPKHRNSFLRNQLGLFTHLPFANSYFLENESWPSIEDVVEKSTELRGALKKYYLPTSEADNLIRILFDCNITTHQLMPSLDNIARAYEYAAQLFDKK